MKRSMSSKRPMHRVLLLSLACGYSTVGIGGLCEPPYNSCAAPQHHQWAFIPGGGDGCQLTACLSIVPEEVPASLHCEAASLPPGSPPVLLCEAFPVGALLSYEWIDYTDNLSISVDPARPNRATISCEYSLLPYGGGRVRVLGPGYDRDTEGFGVSCEAEPQP